MIHLWTCVYIHTIQEYHSNVSCLCSFVLLFIYVVCIHTYSTLIISNVYVHSFCCSLLSCVFIRKLSIMEIILNSTVTVCSFVLLLHEAFYAYINWNSPECQLMIMFVRSAVSYVFRRTIKGNHSNAKYLIHSFCFIMCNAYLNVQ